MKTPCFSCLSSPGGSDETNLKAEPKLGQISLQSSFLTEVSDRVKRKSETPMSRERSNKGESTPESATSDLIRRLQEGKTALKAQDLAQLFGVTQQHIYKLAATGVIPSFRVGCAVRFDPSVVADWLKKRT
jgi:excisionase family DNA binding protein